MTPAKDVKNAAFVPAFAAMQQPATQDLPHEVLCDLSTIESIIWGVETVLREAADIPSPHPDLARIGNMLSTTRLNLIATRRKLDIGLLKDRPKNVFEARECSTFNLPAEVLAELPTIESAVERAISMLQDADSQSHTLLSHAECLLIETKQRLIAAHEQLAIGLAMDRPTVAARMSVVAPAPVDGVRVDEAANYIFQLQAQLRGAAAIIGQQENYASSDELMAVEKLLVHALEYSQKVLFCIDEPIGCAA